MTVKEIEEAITKRATALEIEPPDLAGLDKEGKLEILNGMPEAPAPFVIAKGKSISFQAPHGLKDEGDTVTPDMFPVNGDERFAYLKEQGTIVQK